MMLPVCAKCKRFFRPKKNGIFFEEGMPVARSLNTSCAGFFVSPIDGDLFCGKRVEHIGHQSSVEETTWESYRLWSGDLYECRGCGAEIVVGFGAQPIEINNHEGYKERVASFESEFMVVDPD